MLDRGRWPSICIDHFMVHGVIAVGIILLAISHSDRLFPCLRLRWSRVRPCSVGDKILQYGAIVS